MREHPPGIRAFIALELDGQCRQALQDIQHNLRRTRAQVRWLKPEAMHLTLLFLGTIQSHLIPTLADGMDRIAAGIPCFSFEMGGVGSFGSRTHPRIIWAGIPNPPKPLLDLQAGVAGLAQAQGIPLEDRPFRPHLTLGRVRGPRNLGALSTAMEQMPDRHLASVPVPRVVLMQSCLMPRGAEYRLLHASRLNSGQKRHM